MYRVYVFYVFYFCEFLVSCDLFPGTIFQSGFVFCLFSITIWIPKLLRRYFRVIHYENLPIQYTEILLALQIEDFQLKIFDIFLILAQNIDCGYTSEPPRRGGSIEYPQSMFWSKNKKNRHTPANPNFTI